MKQVTDYVYAEKLRYGWAGSRQQLIEIVDELLSRVPEEQRSSARIEIDTTNEWEVDYVEVKACFRRPQTAAEAAVEKEQEERRQAWKRETLARLKKELGE